jgi:ABC-type nitrate/sulfonate/bicarbonate transport system ATPase subunit
MQDDPFSSLDLPTAAHIFEDGILHFCLMKRKRTVVLVTHELHFLPFAHAVSMKDLHGVTAVLCSLQLHKFV